MTEPKVAIQQRYFTNCINPIISKNLNPTMQFVQDCYNDRQDRYVEHRDNINFPIRLYGYEMESAGLCFGKGEAGGSKLTLQFRVRPKPYAFEGANSGVSEEACAAIARDMKIAVFHWPPLAPVVRRDKFTPETAAAKLIDYWLNNNNPKPVEFHTVDCGYYLAPRSLRPTYLQTSLGHGELHALFGGAGKIGFSPRFAVGSIMALTRRDTASVRIPPPP